MCSIVCDYKVTSHFSNYELEKRKLSYLGKYGSAVQESRSASLVGEAFEVKKLFHFSRLLMKGNEVEFCKLHL